MHIRIGAMQDFETEASLEYISPKAIESNGANQFEIKAAVKVTEGHKIRSGYSANAEIVLEKVDQVLSVPESALEFDGDDTYVYRKNGSSYERIAVKTGLSDGVNIEITEGLKQGEIVRGPKIVE